MADLYDVLGVDRSASADDLKRAYRRKARECHPDAGGNEEQFKSVTHAYEVLSDRSRRARYDQFGDDGTSQARGGGDPFGGFGGINDVIDAFFGQGFGQQTARPRRTTPGRDVLVAVGITLEEVVTGTTRDIEVDVASTCDACSGHGGADGGKAETCGTCGGAGQVQRLMRTAFGQLATATACDACGGEGARLRDPCRICGGDGRVRQQRVVTVTIPAGLETGDRLPVRGEGEAGRRNAPAGDLYLQIDVEQHPTFQRDGRKLIAAVGVSFPEVALGSTVEVDTIDGDTVTVEIAAGTQPGDVLVVKKAGLPVRGGGRRGDMHLLVQVDVPKHLSEQQCSLLRDFVAVTGDTPDASDDGFVARLRRVFDR
ncbi:MAG: J domain-containing protein [Nitriliruptoraceae bacterium]